jgi:metal-responsive CopG/Arc/MetJ family transcriptional regulator
MRTIIDLSDRQVRELDILGKREKVSRSESIRRAVDVYLAQEAGKGWERRPAFGAWGTGVGDAVDLQCKLRDEWSR